MDPNFVNLVIHIVYVISDILMMEVVHYVKNVIIPVKRVKILDLMIVLVVMNHYLGAYTKIHSVNVSNHIIKMNKIIYVVLVIILVTHVTDNQIHNV